MDAINELSSISDSESFDDSNKYEQSEKRKHKRKHSKSKKSKERRRKYVHDSELESNCRKTSRGSAEHQSAGDASHGSRHRSRRHHRSSRGGSASSERSSDSDANARRQKHSKRSKKRRKHGEERRSRHDRRRHRSPSSDADEPAEREPKVEPKQEQDRDNEASRWDEGRANVALEARVKSEAPSGSESDERLGNRAEEAHHTEDRQTNNVRNGAQQNGAREEWGKPEIKSEEPEEEPEEKDKPNLGLSGKLTEDANSYKGVVIKYSQPSEARKPKRRWRWYIFKGDEELPFLPLHRQSAYLIGRERRVVDVPTDHPSCSKQHAVLQYRLVRYKRDDDTTGRTVKPYIIDLESANGTYVNNRRITTRAYVELLEKDVVKFGYSSREYVLLHETSKDSDADTADGGLDMSPVSALMSMGQ